MIIQSRSESVWSALLVGLCLLVGFPVYFGIVDWVQPSFVGLIWGGQFVLGIWLGAASQHSLFKIVIACVSFLWWVAGFQEVTHFSYRESLLFSSLIMTCGFAISRWDRRVIQRHWQDHQARKTLQVSLLDIFVATTFSAVLISGLRNLTAPPALLVGVGWALTVGCCCSWMAYHWAWNDERPIGLPVLMVLAAIGIGYGWLLYVAPSVQFRELCSWLLCGPASVLAAQCFTVLAALALARSFVPTISDTLCKECDLR